MADEFIDILNEKGSFSGTIQLKSEAHKKGLWHASTQIWIYTPDGKILIQKRTANKDTYPNLWDISVAGHLSAGDTPESASLREIEEEIGLIISAKALHFLKTVKNSKQPSKTIIDNEFNHLFLCCNDIKIEELKLQTEEVADVKLLLIDEFKNQLKNNYSEFVPHGMEYYTYIINSIISRLELKSKY